MGFPAPSVSAPTLSNYQGRFGGVTFGPATPYRYKSISGLDLPGMRSADVPRPRTDGEFVGLDIMSGRDIIVDFTIGPDGASLPINLAALAAATVPSQTTETPFYLKLPDTGLLVSMCRARRRNFNVDTPNYVGGLLQSAPVMWHATDPNFYSAPTIAQTVGLPTPGVGLTFNVTFDTTFGGASSGGLLLAVNGGNRTCWPIFTITGPCTNPRIQNLVTGAQLAFGITLVSGDTLVIDTDLHSIVLNGGAARRNALVPGSTFFGCTPGTTQIGFFSADASLVAGTLTAWSTSAWLL